MLGPLIYVITNCSKVEALLKALEIGLTITKTDLLNNDPVIVYGT
jgi:hypothetical protein